MGRNLKWNEFNADYEKFYYEIISGSTSWDWELEEDVWVESTSYQLLEVTKIDDESWMVTQAQTSRMTKDELEGLSFMGGLSGLMALMGVTGLASSWYSGCSPPIWSSRWGTPCSSLMVLESGL